MFDYESPKPKEPTLLSSGQALLIIFVQFLPNAYIRYSRCGQAHNAIATRVRSVTNDSSRWIRFCKIGNHCGCRVAGDHACVAVESVPCEIHAGINQS